ncbi:MAG: zf-HC2 domain-containing protein [Candidatus Eremiobacteraeota bacterium]|nr:zf-HC2 domain-containing protein [Candidatus Eremiobacteraeota bacterium]
MKCTQAQEWMSEKLDQALDRQRADRLDEHFQDCSQCRQEWQALRESWELLGILPELEPSPLFRARVWEKIRHDQKAPAWNFKRWLGGLGLSLAGLALCLNFSANAPLATPTLPPPAPKELAQNLAAGELQEWDARVEVIPSLEAVAREDSPLTAMPLGDLSHDYFALDDTLEEFTL